MGAGGVEALVGFSWLVLGTGRGILECLDWLLTTRAFEGLVQGLWQKLMKVIGHDKIFRGSRCG